MHVSRLFPPERLEQLIEEGLISRQVHPSGELFIYNYSNLCQFRSAWNKVTLNCRGLILDKEGNIVSRPFPKFFNVEEHPRSDILWNRPFQLFEKLDGSLGILYRTPSGGDGILPDDPQGGTGTFSVATRGSFASDQAKVATQIYRQKYEDIFLPKAGYTYLFEIIYPGNRIVVDYGEMEDLIFLAAVHNETGANVFDVDWPGHVAQRFDAKDIHPKDLKDKLHLGDNAEGFVLYFPHANQRMKAKFEDYVAKHRLIFGLSTTSVWENLKAGHSVEDLVKDLPDEFFAWANKWSAALTEEFNAISAQAFSNFRRCVINVFPYSGPDNIGYVRQHRKEFAAVATKCQNPSLLFSLLDNNMDKFDEQIWKLIKPDWERPVFLSNEEDT